MPRATYVEISVWVFVAAAILVCRSIGLSAISVGISLPALLVFPGTFIWDLIKPMQESHSRIDRFAFTLAVSVGVNTLMMFFLGLVGEINFMTVLVGYMLVNITFLFLILRRSNVDARNPPKETPIKSAIPAAPLLAMSAVIVIFYFFHALTFPFTSWDAIASYNRWAIQIVGTGTLRDVGASGFSLYPLGVSLSYAWVYIVSGQLVVKAAHGVSPIFGLIALAYCFLFAKELRSSGPLAVFLALLSPLFASHFIAGYADLPSAGFATASALYLTRYLRHRKIVDLVLAGVMAALSLWMKPTGFYLVVVTPLAYLAAEGANRSGKQLAVIMLGEVVVLPWLLYALVSHGTGGYVADALALSNAPDLWGRQNLTLIARLQQATSVVLAPVQAVPVVFLMFAGLLYIILRDRSIRWVAVFYVTLFIALWSVFFSYDGRYLITFWPMMAAFGSAAIVRWFEILRASSKSVHTLLWLRRAWPQVSTCLLLILALTPATWGAIEGAIQGPGPTISWSISHVFASDDEKLLAVLGPFYDVVLFFKSNGRIYEASVVSMDARFPGILPNATYAWPSTMNDLRGYSFLIVPSWAFRMSFWNTTRLADLIRSNSVSMRLVYQVNWEQGLKGYGDGYRVFEAYPSS